MSQFQEQLENIPGYGIAMDKFNEYAEDHWNVGVDPYYDKKTGKKLKLPKDITTKDEQKCWNKIQSLAWQHDKCMLGSCGIGMDCGLGLVPFVVFFFPVLGPLVMYAMHSRLIAIAEKQFNLPNKLQAQLQSNIGFDLLITFPPVIGSFFGWLHSCSTRNAGLIYAYIDKMAKQRAESGMTYGGRGVTAGNAGLNQQHFGHANQFQQPTQQPQQTQQSQQHARNVQYSQPQQPQPAYKQQKQSTFTAFQKSKNPRANVNNTIEVGQQQQSGFI
ncbi:uncharacterized protein KGF55_004498 [Candida pseudojiufengensis]|uniref:uncharacterized protein n=1 Tax=Candida pseudojiufengensis TaxID=497109 RepID=UPI0022247015|nr:uncharacterized protein KGF55_004498 [Candida pseudojiufengensis]KAI5960605.1 hypothetical protein KGF55_004498 [Candida pseudojiufengensis]